MTYQATLTHYFEDEHDVEHVAELEVEVDEGCPGTYWEPATGRSMDPRRLSIDGLQVPLRERAALVAEMLQQPIPGRDDGY